MNSNLKEEQRASLIAQKEILSFNEALLFLDISSSKLYKLSANGEIPKLKPKGSNKLYFKKEELTNWIQGTKSSDSEDLLAETLTKIQNHGK